MYVYTAYLVTYIYNNVSSVCMTTLRRILATMFALGKQYVLRIPNECLWPYVSSVQCACVILLSVACPALQYFSTLTH